MPQTFILLTGPSSALMVPLGQEAGDWQGWNADTAQEGACAAVAPRGLCCPFSGVEQAWLAIFLFPCQAGRQMGGRRVRGGSMAMWICVSSPLELSGCGSSTVTQ